MFEYCLNDLEENDAFKKFQFVEYLLYSTYSIEIRKTLSYCISKFEYS